MWKCRDCRSCGKAMDNSEDGVTHNHLNNSPSASGSLLHCAGVIHITTTPTAAGYGYEMRKERRKKENIFA